MKKEYDLTTLKERKGKIKLDEEASKVQISIRIEANDLIEIKNEAMRLGIPYQTFMNSILHRYVTGQLVDPKALDLKSLLKKAS